jgi:hypothetical protein
MPAGDPRLPRETLHGMDDDEYFWTLMAPAWDDAGAGTPGQRALAVTTYLVRDVENGGMWQALWNRTADELAEVVAAFERLGAAEHAATVRAATRLLLGDDPPRDEEARRAALERHPRDWVVDRLEPLDERLYDETRLWPHFRRYVDAHPSEFFRPG